VWLLRGVSKELETDEFLARKCSGLRNNRPANAICSAVNPAGILPYLKLAMPRPAKGCPAMPMKTLKNFLMKIT
jgi:hypothetical protein